MVKSAHVWELPNILKFRIQIGTFFNLFNSKVICIYIISDSFESSEIKGSANLNTKFQDVWKFPDMSRLYHPSFFGARIIVSTKVFLWNPSFNANLFFSDNLGI